MIDITVSSILVDNCVRGFALNDLLDRFLAADSLSPVQQQRSRHNLTCSADEPMPIAVSEIKRRMEP